MAQPNYMTPRGVKRMQMELHWLDSEERPKVVAEVAYAASLGDRSDNAEYRYGKGKLRQIDGRRTFLVKRLRIARVVDPVLVLGDKVKFGATVVVEDEEGEQKTWRIYGEDEVDVERGVISLRSPLARALMGKEAGDSVAFVAPRGKRELELLDVCFEAQEPLEEWEWKTARYARA
jgi:transcription elongation factor GreB